MEKDVQVAEHFGMAAGTASCPPGVSFEASIAPETVCGRGTNEQLDPSLGRFPLENPHPVLRISQEGTVLFANPASRQLLTDCRSTSGNPVLEYLRTRTKEAFLSRKTCQSESEWSGWHYLWFFVPISDAGYVNIYGLDVTTQERAERVREETLAELERRNAELERFAYVVSHDLKTPLITICGFLDHLERDAAEGRLEQMADDTARIRKAAQKMQEMLDELLHLARIGRVVNPFETVSLTELAREATELTAGSIARHHARVSIAPDLPMVFGDRQRLLEVLQNLLDNAVKFSRERSVPQIEIGARMDNQTEGSHVCYVRDNGMGIDPCYHPRIFELFEKLDQKSDGAGVGLALVKRILEWHGGRVWVESGGRGTGSTFCFVLPPRREDTSHGSQNRSRKITVHSTG